MLLYILHVFVIRCGKVVMPVLIGDEVEIICRRRV